MKKTTKLVLGMCALAMSFGFTINALAEGYLSLSQTNISLNAGQNTTITAYPPSGQTVNVLSVSNSYVAYANISNNIITVYGLSAGTSEIRFGTYDNYTASLYVTVNGGTTIGNISFSQNNISMIRNESRQISIYSNSSTYYLSSNSNSNAVSAYISGSTLNLTGLNNGNSTITVSNSLGQSSSIYVTVTGTTSGNLSFSQNNPSVAVNQSLNISIYNPNNSFGSYYISSNSNSNIVNASISGNILMLTGRANGTSTITVYQSGTNYSGNLFINVTGQVLGSNIYANGTLINDNGTIYITYKNSKTPFANAQAFLGLGYEFSDVINGSTTSLTHNYYTIGSSAIPHPWGSWIQSGNTIYFVHEAGLIPIPTWEVFLNNNGRTNLVVPVNSYDFGRQLLEPMQPNDQRLR